MAKQMSPETETLIRGVVEQHTDSYMREQTVERIVADLKPIIASIDANAEARGRALERGEKVAP